MWFTRFAFPHSLKVKGRIEVPGQFSIRALVANGKDRIATYPSTRKRHEGDTVDDAGNVNSTTLDAIYPTTKAESISPLPLKHSDSTLEFAMSKKNVPIVLPTPVPHSTTRTRALPPRPRFAAVPRRPARPSDPPASSLRDPFGMIDNDALVKFRIALAMQDVMTLANPGKTTLIFPHPNADDPSALMRHGRVSQNYIKTVIDPMIEQFKQMMHISVTTVLVSATPSGPPHLVIQPANGPSSATLRVILCNPSFLGPVTPQMMARLDDPDWNACKAQCIAIHARWARNLRVSQMAWTLQPFVQIVGATSRFDLLSNDQMTNAESASTRMVLDGKNAHDSGQDERQAQSMPTQPPTNVASSAASAQDNSIPVELRRSKSLPLVHCVPSTITSYIDPKQLVLASPLRQPLAELEDNKHTPNLFKSHVSLVHTIAGHGHDHLAARREQSSQPTAVPLTRRTTAPIPLAPSDALTRFEAQVKNWDGGRRHQDHTKPIAGANQGQKKDHTDAGTHQAGLLQVLGPYVASRTEGTSEDADLDRSDKRPWFTRRHTDPVVGKGTDKKQWFGEALGEQAPRRSNSCVGPRASAV